MMDWITQLSKLHILVIGDLIIDRYIYGSVDRISPEAPIPVVNQRGLDHRPGGAANVALNLHAMGIRCSLLTVTGADELGDLAQELVNYIENPISAFIKDSGRVTTCKTRVMANLHHIVRIDHEDQTPIDGSITGQIIERIHSINEHQPIDVVILQDYEKGVFHPANIPQIISAVQLKNIPVIVDPKDKNFWYYKNVTLFKPNKSELEKALGYKIKLDLKSIEVAEKDLRQKLNNKISTITLSEGGIFISDGVNHVWDRPSSREVIDVCGAGDAVVSVLAALYGISRNLAEMVHVANIAGGLVCEISGVSPVPFERLVRELE